MTRATAQAGNRASKTVRRPQWWESGPERRAVTPGVALAVLLPAYFAGHRPTRARAGNEGARPDDRGQQARACAGGRMARRELHALKLSLAMWNFAGPPRACNELGHRCPLAPKRPAPANSGGATAAGLYCHRRFRPGSIVECGMQTRFESGNS